MNLIKALSQEAKILIGITAVTLVIILGGVVMLSGKAADDAKPVDAKLLILSDSLSQGPKNAKVTVVEFADLQCPGCAQANPVVKQLLKAYNEKIRYVYRFYPLPQHKNAIIAAEAALAANDQGKLWEMVDKLFENQSDWAETDNPLDLYTTYAKDLQLDSAKFIKAIKDDKYRERILQDVAGGGKVGVNSTPTFYINGVKFTEAPTFDNMKAKIDAAMK